MVAVVKVAISNREQLATLRVKDDVMVLSTMLWPTRFVSRRSAFSMNMWRYARRN